MKPFIWILTFAVLMQFPQQAAGQKHNVFILTDINLVGGDPDDRQSLVHLLWYSDELNIMGIVPDYWNGKGVEACLIALEAYREDYKIYRFDKAGLMPPEILESRIVTSPEAATKTLYKAALESETPLYVLVWGNMLTLKNALFEYPEILPHIRVLSIGTGIKYGPRDEVPGEDCTAVNWNGNGRNEIYNNRRFDKLWWVESNWTYNGMFEGQGPSEMFEKLSVYGAMGQQIKDVNSGHDWAQYFRVGDTPSVTYLIDNEHDINDPESSSWAGRFKKPFPNNKPNYYTDDNGEVEWNYADPCSTWVNLRAMYAHNKNTLLERREEMYKALISKLEKLYQ